MTFPIVSPVPTLLLIPSATVYLLICLFSLFFPCFDLVFPVPVPTLPLELKAFPFSGMSSYP